MLPCTPPAPDVRVLYPRPFRLLDTFQNKAMIVDLIGPYVRHGSAKYPALNVAFGGGSVERIEVPADFVNLLVVDLPEPSPSPEFCPNPAVFDFIRVHLDRSKE